MNFLYILIISFFTINTAFSFELDHTNRKTIDFIKIKTNKKVRIAIIDTGIDYNNRFLKDKIYVFNGGKKSDNYGVDFSLNNLNKTITRTPKDTHGHGTHIAGIISAINPNVELVILKYYNPLADGKANLEASLKAMSYAISLGVDIINYSGGGPEQSDKEKLLIQKAKENNILVISASGNEKANIDPSYTKKYYKQEAYFPASYNYDNIISVGAINDQYKLNFTSNWGIENVDIVAPGYKINSLLPFNQIKSMTGTSQATAFVTGVASLVKSYYNINDYKTIKNIILNNCKTIPSLKNKIKNGCSLNMKNIFINRKLASKKKF
jgi:thermitase